jgi:hypothetical protein
MIDLTKISDGLLLARGCYATVRGEHEDAKKRLAVLCGHMGAINSQILRKCQPDSDDVPDGVSELLDEGRATMEKIAVCTAEIESLARQRAELKPSAWGK